MPEENFALSLLAPLNAAEDYDSIHSAMLESARGRWFLQEYTRRNRTADTNLLLAAIARIEAALKIGGFAPTPGGGPDLQLLELRDAIVLTKQNIASTRPDGRLTAKAADFSRLASAVTAIALRLRACAERVQETGWTLRDRGGHERECETLEAQMREIARACDQLDEVGSGAAMVAALLQEIEERVDGMIAQASVQPAPQAAPPAPLPAAERPAAAALAAAAAIAGPLADTRISRTADAQDRTLESEQGIGQEIRQDTRIAKDEPHIEQVRDEDAILAPLDPQFERAMAEAFERAAGGPVESAAAASVAAPEEETPQQAMLQTHDPQDDAPAAQTEQPDLSDRVFAILSGAEPAPDTAPDTAQVAEPEAAEPEAAGPEAPAEPKARSSRPSWFDALAPLVRARNSPDIPPPAKIEFTFAGDSIVTNPLSDAVHTDPVASLPVASLQSGVPAADDTPAAAQPVATQAKPLAEDALTPAPETHDDIAVELLAIEDLAAHDIAAERAQSGQPEAAAASDNTPVLSPDANGHAALQSGARATFAAALRREITAAMADFTSVIRTEVGKVQAAERRGRDAPADALPVTVATQSVVEARSVETGFAAGAPASLPEAASAATATAASSEAGIFADEEPHLSVFAQDEETGAVPLPPQPQNDDDARARSARASDPLAPIVSLSEEEKVALFS